MTRLVHTKSSFFDLRSRDPVTIGEIPYVVDHATRGGMGFVLLLTRESGYVPRGFNALGGKIALKAVLPEAVNAEGIGLFKRELTVWSSFRHPSIVWLLEILECDDAGWIAAMDWRKGSLRDILKDKGKLSVSAGLNIMAQIIDGLSYAYEQDQVLHLDLKPENILYDNDPNYRGEEPDYNDAMLAKWFMISDWGIASVKQPKLNEIIGLPFTAAASHRTFNNMGTLLYMAPERFRDGFSSSIASDVFSLGMIHLEMLTGRLPFNANSHPVQTLLSSQYLTEARLLLHQAKIPKPICSFILSMLASSPSNRPQDYSTLSSLLLRSYDRANGFLSKFFN